MGRTLQAKDGHEDGDCGLEESPALTAFTAPHSSPGSFQCNEVLRDAGIEPLDDAERPEVLHRTFKSIHGLAQSSQASSEHCAIQSAWARQDMKRLL